MAEQRRLTISNPAIGGSGWLTLATMEADAGITAGYYATIHQCRGLAQAGGPMCMDVMIREEEAVGGCSHYADHINGYDLPEAWRGISAVKGLEEFRKAFPRGLTVVTDYYVEVPILVTASLKGPRYLTREEFIKRFEDLIGKGYDIRVVAYDFKKHEFPTIVKGPFSFGILTADVHLRKDDRLLSVPREAAIEGVLANVPLKKGGRDDERLNFNRLVFERGYEARERAGYSEKERIIYL